MQVARDLLRDLVGILFPGGLLVAFFLWFLWAIAVIIDSSISFNFLPTDNNFLILIIFSYIAGQSLRIKRLDDLEKRCTDEYRKKTLPNINQSDWEKQIQKIKDDEEKYYAGNLSLEQLKEIYREYNNKFRYWEPFPYGYRLKGRRLLYQSENYIKFFEKYDKQGITEFDTFFNFCKSTVYEYSPSFKEEMLRQESLVRLFAGLYYVTKFGKILSVTIGTLHIVMMLISRLQIGIVKYENGLLSLKIALVSLFAFLIFLYMSNDIINRLRQMRVREVNLAHDAFYLISKEHDLDL